MSHFAKSCFGPVRAQDISMAAVGLPDTLKEESLGPGRALGVVVSRAIA